MSGESVDLSSDQQLKKADLVSFDSPVLGTPSYSTTACFRALDQPILSAVSSSFGATRCRITIKYNLIAILQGRRNCFLQL